MTGHSQGFFLVRVVKLVQVKTMQFSITKVIMTRKSSEDKN
jgi:hypothetical protein